jgi:hypothetical protein
MLRAWMVAGFGLFLSGCASPPPPPPQEVVLETSQASVLTRIGEDGVPTAWNLAPELNPDVFEAGVPPGESREVCFTSERDEKCFDVRAGDTRDFVIVRDGVRHNRGVQCGLSGCASRAN